MKYFQLLIYVVSFNIAFSMPPRPGKITNLISFNQSKGYTPKIFSPITVKKGTRSPQKTAKTIGSLKFPVLLIQFINLSNDSVSTTTFYSNLMNGTNASQPSLKKYYLDMSGGKLNLTFMVYGIFTSKSNYEYYGKNDSSGYDIHPGELVGEAIDFAISNGVDFSQFDNDNDGRVDVVIVVHAGMGEEADPYNTDYTNYIWSHRWTLSEAKTYGDGSGARTNNGKIIDDYTIQPEFVEKAGDTTIGVFAHELGHIFGLPDLYDTSYQTYGVGDWSLMSFGAWLGSNDMGESPAPLLSWEKARLGWIEVENVSLVAGTKDVLSYFLFLFVIIYTILQNVRNEKKKLLIRLFIFL